MKNYLFIIILFQFFIVSCVGQHSTKEGDKKIILLRSSWQTVNIGDIAHTPGVLTILEKRLPDVEVKLWASNVDRGVREMLLKRFPDLQIILNSDTAALNKAFKECDFLLHGSGPYLVAENDVKRWVEETGKPYGVFGISLADYNITEKTKEILSKSKFIFFRDSVSLDVAKSKGIKSPIMEFGPDGAFGVDLRNDDKALPFLQQNSLEEKKYICVIPRYRKTPYWLVHDNVNYNKVIDDYNQKMKEHDLLPYREAIISIIRHTNDIKVLICPEDMTQIELGKEMLYDPLPEDVKRRVVLKKDFWLTDEAVSVYVRSLGLFGLEQHSPIMCIGNGIPALLGRFKEQTSKGYMWYNIGLEDWFFDSDDDANMQQLVPTIISMINNYQQFLDKTLEANKFVNKRYDDMVNTLKNNL